jgi:hypothetical protein
MRGPRLSFSDEFREQWDKENLDPATREYSPRARRQQVIDALRDITEQVKKGDGGRRGGRSREERAAKDRAPPPNTWLDELLSRNSL